MHSKFGLMKKFLPRLIPMCRKEKACPDEKATIKISSSLVLFDVTK